MASSSSSVASASTSRLPYDPTLPNVSMRPHLEGAVDEVCRRSWEVAKFESRHLSLEGRLVYLAQNLPKMLPFPFSGVIALQAGDGFIVQASHCPNQPEFTTDQIFNALSIGKLFTATAVMQLIEDGKFSLKTPVSELLESNELDLPLGPPYLEHKPDPESLQNLRRHSDEITIEHLLSHTAGFVEREESEEKGIVPGDNWDHKHKGEYYYSNYGYQLLPKIIGKYTDYLPIVDHETRFRFHIEERIFRPAHMEGAIREIHSPAQHRPACFEISEEGIATRVESPDPYPHGNGCWRMTASDLLAFGRAIRQHAVLISEDSFRTILRYQGRLGFWVDREQETAKIMGYGHPGGGRGMSSFFHTWRTNPSITAVVLSNYSGCQMVKPALDELVQQ